jgi:ABC-type amino acid transport substrate-binding protein
MQEIAGGKVLKGIIDVYPKKIRSRIISLRPARANQILGTNISTQQTQGPNQNIILTDSRQVDFGMTTMGIALQAWEGKGDWTQGRKFNNIRAMFPMYDTPFHFVTLAKTGIKKVADLKGKAVSYPAPTALAATMMPQYFLQTQGLDVNRDIANLYVGSQESSIMNVYLGKSAAGATWPPPWIAFTREHPNIAAQLEVKWETASLPNNGLVVRNDVPAPLRRQVEEALFNLHTTPEGKAILARMPLSRFEPATSATYEPVRTFLRQYAATVRPLEGN